MACSHDKKLLEDFTLETVDYKSLSHCELRYFKRLSGLVDVSMVSTDGFNSLYEGDYKFSLPACSLKPLDNFQKTLITSMIEFKSESTKKGVAESVEQLKNLVKEYAHKSLKTLEEVKEVFNELKQAEERINIQIEDEIENEELLEKAKQSAGKSIKILRGMAAEMGMMAM